jgi:hypothetical protein
VNIRATSPGNAAGLARRYDMPSSTRSAPVTLMPDCARQPPSHEGCQPARLAASPLSCGARRSGCSNESGGRAATGVKLMPRRADTPAVARAAVTGSPAASVTCPPAAPRADPSNARCKRVGRDGILGSGNDMMAKTRSRRPRLRNASIRRTLPT